MVAKIADLHGQEHDPEALGAFENWARRQRLDEIVINGDLGEFESCDRHGGVKHWDYREELEAVRDLLKRLRPLAARLTVRQGNHDTKAARMLAANAPRMATQHDLARDLGLAELGVCWSPSSPRPLERGTVLLTHGHEFMRAPYPPPYHARMAWEAYGRNGYVVMYDHVHRRQQISHRANCFGALQARSGACMCKLQPNYQREAPTGWEHGFDVLYLEPGRRTQIEQVDIIDGAFYWGGRRFSS